MGWDGDMGDKTVWRWFVGEYIALDGSHHRWINSEPPERRQPKLRLIQGGRKD